MKAAPRAIEPSAMELMQSYDWPGNVRELENLVKRIMVMQSDQAITPEHIALALPLHDVSEKRADHATWDELVEQELRREAGKKGIYDRLLGKLEEPLIMGVLERCDGNQVRAAEMLGINRNTLYKKMKKLGLK
jgi:two-component system nitrogen regulation response regulator GlnG